jgi:poly-beta-1,6-N-acetyl-D-glucosamine synthase
MQWIPAILILPYLILLLKIYKGLRKIKPFIGSADATINVSVVIACRNEQNNLPDILKDLDCQDYPASLLEIIIVDDNSADDTYNVASSFRSRFLMTVLKNSGNGKKQALRTGIRISKGELIVTTDADCRAGKKWITTISSFYKINRADLIICPVIPETGKGFFGGFRELEFLSLQGITAGSAAINNALMCNGANLSFTRESYDRHSDNLHDEIGSGDDIFLLHNIKKDPDSKIEWIESFEASVITSIPDTLTTFLSQRKRWISKWPAYDDNFTILAGIATFVIIFAQISLYAASLINITWFGVTAFVFLLKSIPDYLVLRTVTTRYNRASLLRWFFPSQLVYPFYVMIVALISLFGNKKSATSFPSQKET